VVTAKRLGVQSDDVVLVLGPTEQPAEAGFKVRYLASERLLGEVTPAPAPGTPGAAGMRDDTQRDLVVPWASAGEADTWGATPPQGTARGAGAPTPPQGTARDGAGPSSPPVSPPRDTERMGVGPSSPPVSPPRDTEREPSGPELDVEVMPTPVDASVAVVPAARDTAKAPPSWPSVEAASAWLEGGTEPARRAEAESVDPSPSPLGGGQPLGVQSTSVPLERGRPLDTSSASVPSANGVPPWREGADDTGERPAAVSWWKRYGVALGAAGVAAVVALWLLWPTPSDPVATPRPVASARLGLERVAVASASAERATEAVPRATAGGVTAARTAEPRVPSVPTGKTPAARASARPRGVPSAAPVPKEESDAGERDVSVDDQQEARRKRLEAKLAAGKASQSELKALWDLCLRQRDVACSGRVEAALRNSHEQP
jgi:hypothetical protein